MGRNKKTYTDEFKLKCIKELLDGKAFSEVCSSNNGDCKKVCGHLKNLLC